MLSGNCIDAGRHSIDPERQRGSRAARSLAAGAPFQCVIPSADSGGRSFMNRTSASNRRAPAQWRRIGITLDAHAAGQPRQLAASAGATPRRRAGGSGDARGAASVGGAFRFEGRVGALQKFCTPPARVTSAGAPRRAARRAGAAVRPRPPPRRAGADAASPSSARAHPSTAGRSTPACPTAVPGKAGRRRGSTP